MGIVGAKANAALGEVEVVVDGRTYIARFGNRELLALEKRWNVEGLEALFNEGVQRSNARFLEFAHAAFSRHHSDLTEDDVADLLDYREDPDGERNRIVTDAVVAAFELALPKKKAATETTTPIAAAPALTLKEGKGGRSR